MAALITYAVTSLKTAELDTPEGVWSLEWVYEADAWVLTDPDGEIAHCADTDEAIDYVAGLYGAEVAEA